MAAFASALVARLTALRPFTPALAVFAVGVTLAGIDGGYPPAIWYLAALFVLGLLALTVALAPPRPAEGSRLFGAALACYGAFCLWSFGSIAWAEGRGMAWEGANRTLLYGAVLALVGMRPWTRTSARAALALVATGTAGIAAGVLVVSAMADDPARLFLEGRLAAPTGYANATAALWLIAFWPALELASGGTARWQVRGAGLASAALLLEMAVLSQSRGAAIAFPLTALAFLAVRRRRAAGLLALAFVCGITALAWKPLAAVHAAATAEDIGPALAGARWTIAASMAAAFLGAAAAGLAERRLAEFARRRAVGRAARYALAAVTAAIAVTAALSIGDPREWAEARWHDFKAGGYGEVDDDGSRFSGSLGSNRYDFYRVAVNQFRAHPVAGIGADNFAVPYLAERHSSEAPQHPHSLAMRLIAQLGAVGTGLFVLFLGLTFACVARATRHRTPAETGLSAAAVAGFTHWLVHGMADWLWEFAGLGVLAFALLALAARLVHPAAAPVLGDLGRSASRKRLRRAGVVAAAVLAAVSFALPGAAARVERAAVEEAADDPVAALAKFGFAASLNPLSGEALAARGVLARRLGMTSVAREALGRALERDPSSWYVQFQLGLLEAETGRRRAAARRIDAALALNPRQRLLNEVRHSLSRGGYVDARAVERDLEAARHAKLHPVRDQPG